ncbi:MAG TPA: MarR family transcriptional regulator [Burkholderiaceae bacterium]
MDTTQKAARPARRADDDDALELVHSVMHAYRSLQYRALRDGPHDDITHMDSKVLGFFSRRPGATQSDLAQHSGRDKAQLARLVKGLRDRGLIEAQVDDIDRRNVRLWLTGEGRAVQRALHKQALRVGADAVAGLTADEHRQLCALLRHVMGNLDELA